MFVFGVILSVLAVLVLLDAVGVRPAWLRSRRGKVRIALAVAFLLAAVSRLATPESLLAMIPESLPLRREALYLSGLFEALGAVGLLVPRVRRVAGRGLVALLVVVFPANVNVAVHNLQIANLPGSPVEQWLRLPLQLVLIGLVWWASRPDAATVSGPAGEAPAQGRALGALSH